MQMYFFSANSGSMSGNPWTEGRLKSPVAAMTSEQCS